MKVDIEKNDNSITLLVEGRVDTNTSGQLQSEILTNFQKTNTLIIDMGSVEYVSSAGLRALLIGQKTAMSKGGTMEVIHVSEEVMSVLEITGFSDILTIR